MIGPQAARRNATLAIVDHSTRSTTNPYVRRDDKERAMCLKQIAVSSFDR
jgi:hypothetical protein